MAADTAAIRLSIVFLNYNKLAETRHTVNQLEQLCSQRDDIEIIAVDNGSSDGTAEFLDQQSTAQVILRSDNTGIAGYNQGFEQAQGEYILVLDDDSCPQDIESLDQIMHTMDQEKHIGLVACHINSPDGSAQSSWHLPDTGQFSPSPFFIGCGFVIRRPLFKAIGWYPEDFFLYQNEIDVAFKVRQQDFQIYYDPNCIIIHRGIPGQRPGWRRIYYPTRNTLWLIQRYYPQPQAAYMLISRLIIGFIRAIQFGLLSHYFSAVKDAFRQPQEKHIASERIRQQSIAFWKQNSFFHQLFRSS